MRTRLPALLLWFCGSIFSFSQTNPAISVNESLSKIHISGDSVSPILAIENRGSKVVAHIGVELLDTNDSVRGSGEAEASLNSGRNHVRLELRGWNQKPDEWNDSVWYRLRYRVMVSGQAAVEGILALSTKADGVFDMRVVGSSVALPGRPYRLRVYTESVADLRPMAGVEVKAELEGDSDDAAESKLALSATTDGRGFAQMEFKIPPTWTDSADIKVVASKGQVVRQADSEVSFRANWRFFVNTDKPLYQPGQTVHVRALMLDTSKHALAHVPTQIAIADEEQTIVFHTTEETSRFGVARADWEIPENLRLGNYTVAVVPGGDDDDSEPQGLASIRISRYELPTYTVNVKTDRAYYLPGQNAAVTVSADYLFGKPVTKGHVKVARETGRRWNFKEQRWEVEEEQKWEGNTDPGGKFVARIDMSKEQEDLDEYVRFRDLDFAAYYTESTTGKIEQRRFRIRITHQPIHIYVIEGGNLAPGQLPLDFYLSASYADGTPAQCEVAIHQGSLADERPGVLLRTVKTNKYGVARISDLALPLVASSESDGFSARLVVLARDREGRTGYQTQDLYDASSDFVMQAKTDHALYRPDEPIELELHSNRREASLLVDVLREGRVIRSQSVRLRGGHAFLVLPYGPEFQGELTVVAYSPANVDRWSNLAMVSRTVLYPRDPALHLTAKFDRATYRPGEDAALTLHVRGQDGAPVEAALGAVIFDQAVEERARSDAEFGEGRGYGFDAEFQNYWYEPAELGGLTRAQLDRLDTSHPFADDLELAAEVLLLNRWGDRPLVFGGANYPAGTLEEFGSRFDDELAGVKTALRNAYEKDFSYPHDTDSLKKILQQQGVDFDAVRDPWGSTFQAKFSRNQSHDVMELVSLGPDKKAGTDDDLAVLVLNRPYFQKTGIAINKAMEAYHSRTNRYIRDMPTLRAELAQNGIDWDSMRDPWGHAYEARFGVVNTRYTLTVVSAGPNGRFESSPASDDFVVWTDWSDYFADISLKIDDALGRYFAATGEFPWNEAEFYRALDQAKISRDLLRDAWGHPAYLVFDNQARYQDRIIMDYSETKSGAPLVGEKVQPETVQYDFIHLYSAGEDGIARSPDDFELAAFSREIARQNSTMTQPSANHNAVPLSGGSGGITGLVTDLTGAVVAKTKVTAELNEKISFETKTDDSGRYTFRNLPTGMYTVRAQSPGFQLAIIVRVPVKSLNLTQVNFTLQVGSVSETVEVAANAGPALQTESTAVASVQPHPGTPGPIATPRLREFFPETLFWEPMLETDRHGNSRLHFKFADSITDWKLSLVASTVDGQVGVLDSDIKTFQPFFVEHEPPPVLTEGDEINLPVILRNYLEKPQMLRVEMKSEPWFRFLGPSVLKQSVAAGDSDRAWFRFKVAEGIGEVKQRVTAANRETGDAIEKPVRIHPDGEPRTVTSARLFSEGEDLAVEIPDYAIRGSVEAEVKIYPNLMAHVLESTRSLLEKPYGCGEQTTSSTYPNVMVLRLYKHAGKAPDGVYRTALRYAQLGYARLLSYQHPDGGISVWKQDKPEVALSAYALRFLTDAKEFVDVDPAVIAAIEKYLAGQQSLDGSWTDLAETAYTVISLERSGAVRSAAPATDELRNSLDRGRQYLRTHWATSADPYVLAQVALAAWLGGDQALGTEVNQKLRSMSHREGDSSYWSLESNTLFYEWGRAGRAETTALVVQALARQAAPGSGASFEGEDRELAEQGMLFLIREKDGDGIWYSGQTTVNVLDAFLLMAKAEGITGAGSAEVLVNGAKAGDLEMPAENEITAPLVLDVTKFVRPGRNQISLRNAASSRAASAQAVVRYYLPWEHSSAKPAVNARTGDSDALVLRVSYDRIRAQPDQDIHCRVHAERAGFRGYGMLLAEIGLPPGAVVDRSSLEKAKNASGAWAISQYEIRPDRLVVYLWAQPGGTDFEFAFRERYGIDALTAPSDLYDYYNPDAAIVVTPTRIEVEDTALTARSAGQ